MHERERQVLEQGLQAIDPAAVVAASAVLADVRHALDDQEAR